jgi:lysyl-tRNA synthetase class II
VRCAALLLALAAPAAAQDVTAGLNDYPTVARSEYVFACMAVNGESRQALEQCSCSIDWIASVLPYERYVEAEAILALQQTSGERSSLFRETAMATGILAELRRAQAEAEILCF